MSADCGTTCCHTSSLTVKEGKQIWLIVCQKKQNAASKIQQLKVKFISLADVLFLKEAGIADVFLNQVF